jgi:hypothetical protein
MEKKSDNRVHGQQGGIRKFDCFESCPVPSPRSPIHLGVSRDLSPSGQVRGQIGLAEPGRGVLISVPYLVQGAGGQLKLEEG